MYIKEYRQRFIDVLASRYDMAEAESFFYRVLEDKINMKRIDLALHPKTELTENQIEEWDAILEKLRQFIPIQYILGKAHFYGLEFEVNENTLIPRPETEELVQWMLSDIQQSKNPTIEQSNLAILDIGTGSGCIAIALAKNLPNAKVFAIDISEKALATAKKNAASNRVEVAFLQKDILSTTALDLQFDIIVSNPPYVRNVEKAEIKANVLDHEPHLALFVEDDDALLFYRKIAALAKKSLSPNGKLYFEINQYLGKEMVALLEEMGFANIELRKDIYGNDRMAKGEGRLQKAERK